MQTCKQRNKLRKFSHKRNGYEPCKEFDLSLRKMQFVKGDSGICEFQSKYNSVENSRKDRLDNTICRNDPEEDALNNTSEFKIQ